MTTQNDDKRQGYAEVCKRLFDAIDYRYEDRPANELLDRLMMSTITEGCELFGNDRFAYSLLCAGFEKETVEVLIEPLSYRWHDTGIVYEIYKDIWELPGDEEPTQLVIDPMNICRYIEIPNPFYRGK